MEDDPLNLDFEPEHVLEAMGDKWWPTGVIARSLLPNGGKGIPSNTRSRHHGNVANMLRDLEARHAVVRRRIAEDGRVLPRSEAAYGRTEWKRL